MRQITFASQPSFEKYGRVSRREQFLNTMEAVVPWAKLARFCTKDSGGSGNSFYDFSSFHTWQETPILVGASGRTSNSHASDTSLRNPYYECRNRLDFTCRRFG